MLAAMQFVKECLVSIDDKEVEDDFLVRDWFGDILLVTTKWYRNRCGDELLKTQGDQIHGVVSAFGTPLGLRIPRISEFKTTKPAVKRIVFADGVLDEEDPMEWVTPAPRISDSGSQAACVLQDAVERISTALRQIYRRILVADFTSTKERDLASSVEGHLEKAAADIQSSRHGAAVWEVHLCIEKILKVFLQQAGTTVPQSHDITRLVAEAEQAGLPSCGHLNLQRLPPHGDAIRHRYAELPAPTFENIMEIYDIAIHLVAHVADSLKQSSFAEYKELYIQALPWHPKWKQDEMDNSEE